MVDLPSSKWRTSSYSGGNGGNCIQVHPAGAVRDSKNPGGGVLRADLAALVDAARRGLLR